MIAERVIDYDPDNVSDMDVECIAAAALHLQTKHPVPPPPSSTPVFMFMQGKNWYTSCTVWLADLERAKRTAHLVKTSFDSLHSARTQAPVATPHDGPVTVRSAGCVLVQQRSGTAKMEALVIRRKGEPHL